MSNNAATKVGSGGGVVTSVALAVPSDESVSGSPGTGAVALTISRNTQPANTALRGPVSGGSGVPTYRADVVADLPAVTQQLALSFDSHPASPNALNDEFEATSLNASWNVIKNTVGVVNYSTYIPGSVFVKFTGNQGYSIGKAFAPGSADFSVTIKGNYKIAANFDAITLFITDTDADLISTPGTANGNSIGWAMGAGGAGVAGIQVNKFVAGVRTQFNVAFGNSTYQTLGANTTTAVAVGAAAQGKIYLHIQRVAGTWTAWYSFDGETFFNSANWSSPPTFATPTVGFIVVSLERYGGTSTQYASLDFVRVNQIFF